MSAYCRDAMEIPTLNIWWRSADYPVTVEYVNLMQRCDGNTNLEGMVEVQRRPMTVEDVSLMQRCEGNTNPEGMAEVR